MARLPKLAAAEPAAGGESVACEPPSPFAWPPWTPLHVFQTPARGRARLTLVLDALPSGDAFDDDTTALVLALLVARRRAADLRLVTRAQAAQPAQIQALMRDRHLTIRGELQFRFLPFQRAKAELDLIDGEMLITDRWWNAAGTLAAVQSDRVVHVLQANESAVSDDADSRLGRLELLRRRDLRCVIRTAALKQHFVHSGLSHFQTQALCFEPPVDTTAQWHAALAPVVDHLIMGA